MEGFISRILIFNSKGEKREVKLTNGVNIITGDSKTGKSALVEIIDYCLCSSRCTIPKGKITDFGVLYCLTYIINNKCLIIAREHWEKGGRMYYLTENIEYNVDQIDLSYFQNSALLSSKEVQYYIELELGLQVSNLEDDEDNKSKKASLRNMVSYMFQHQNLMASKFALFYRFTDFYKRQDVIEQFPIFAGFIGQEYYSKIIQMNSLKKQQKQLLKQEKQNSVMDKKLRERLVSLFEDYYALIDREFSGNLSLKELIEASAKLPELDLSKFSSTGIVTRYNSLNHELELLRKKEIEINIKISELKNTNIVGKNYVGILDELKKINEVSKPENEEYICPICGELSQKISDYDESILEASQWLNSEIKFVEAYNTNFWEDIRKLELSRDNMVSSIKRNYGQVKQIERTYLNSETLKNLKDKISYAKGNILLYIETISEGIFKDLNDELITLNLQITELEAEIGKFNIEKKLSSAKNDINKNMNRLALTLDFEDEFKPMNLKFDISNFDLFHLVKKYNNEQKIFLSEMGSGANWVSCHIVLFLSLLRFFAKEKANSPIPLILFFDQPSQVYFPQSISEIPDIDEEGELNIKKQTDIMAVNNMYKTIFDEISNIQDDTGVLPQIIIVDHVDGKELDVKDEFKKFTRHDWRGGKALI